MKLYIPLQRDEMERLLIIAREERRRPQDQAAIFVARALRDANTERKGAEATTA